MDGGIEPDNKIISQHIHCSYLTCAEMQLGVYIFLVSGVFLQIMLLKI